MWRVLLNWSPPPPAIPQYTLAQARTRSHSFPHTAVWGGSARAFPYCEGMVWSPMYINRHHRNIPFCRLKCLAGVTFRIVSSWPCIVRLCLVSMLVTVLPCLHIARKLHLARKFTAQAVCLPQNPEWLDLLRTQINSYASLKDEESVYSLHP
jgi:hypothetical protein